jgi:hypothetical protein
MKSIITLKFYAMPSLCDSTNFNLDKPDKNKAMLKHLQTKFKTEVYEAPSKDYEFFRTGNWQSGGYIVLVNMIKGIISYIVKYEKPAKIEGSTRPVVQTCVWKTFEWATNHLAEKVFFDILLKNCGSIMSDKKQTPEGKRFWQNMMSIANHKGYKIFFIHKNRIISTKETNQDTIDWIDSFQTWGPETKYQLERFMIQLD